MLGSRSTWIVHLCGLSVVGALPFSPSGAGGQEVDQARFGIGFVANAPRQMVGGGGYVVLPVLGGLGLYVDGKVDIDSPAKDRAFVEGLTSEEVEQDPDYSGTRFLKREMSWYRSFNAALVRPLNRFLMVYGGAGYSQGEQYALYDIPTGEVGEIGRAMWVRDPRGDKNRVNVLFGAMFRLSSLVSTHFGFETEPGGVTVGVSLRIPRW